MPVSKTIPLALLDDPEVAMRSEIDDKYIEELAADIARNGLINPVAVKRIGTRYTVVAGHCRTIAMRKLGRDLVDVRDYTDDNLNTERIKCRENLGRRDVNDADIAEYLSDLQEQNHHTMDELVEITGESEDWINKRLSLFAGDREVFDALRTKKINFGHALVLNRFPAEYRGQYLQVVINSTPPIRVVEDFLKQVKLMQTNPLPAQADPQAPLPDAPPPGVVIDACQACRGTELNWTMEFVRVHKHCWNMILDAIQKQERGV